MTIKTLEYIHKLLIEREAATHAEYDAALKLHREYENSETADETLVKKSGGRGLFLHESTQRSP